MLRLLSLRIDFYQTHCSPVLNLGFCLWEANWFHSTTQTGRGPSGPGIP